MSKAELFKWRRQFGISNDSKMGLRYAPYCFTEQGVAMLSSVLGSKTAIEVNIRVIRVFTRMREMLVKHKDILIKLEQIEKKIMKQNVRISRHDRELQMVFRALKELLEPPPQPMKRIGFKQKDRHE